MSVREIYERLLEHASVEQVTDLLLGQLHYAWVQVKLTKTLVTIREFLQELDQSFLENVRNLLPSFKVVLYGGQIAYLVIPVGTGIPYLVSQSNDYEYLIKELTWYEVEESLVPSSYQGQVLHDLAWLHEYPVELEVRGNHAILTSACRVPEQEFEVRCGEWHWVITLRVTYNFDHYNFYVYRGDKLVEKITSIGNLSYINGYLKKGILKALS